MRYLLFLLLLCAISFGCVNSYTLAQSVYSKHITLDEGLPSETIYDLCSSKESGFLYLATDRGIFTYNGTDFRKIQLENPLTNGVTDIHISDEGFIWCRNFSNQLFYSKKPYFTDSLYVFELDSIIKLPPVLIKFSFLNNTLWLCLAEKIVAIDMNSKKIIFEFEAPTGQAFETLFTHKNGVWWATEETTVVYCFDGKTVSTIDLDKDSEFILRFATLENTCAIGHRQNKGILYEFGKDSYQAIPIKNWIQGTYSNNIVAEQGFYWICSNSGLWFLNKNYEAKQLFPDMRVSDICSDYQGHYWVSTLDKGLICMPSLQANSLDIPDKEPFSKITYEQNKILAANPRGELFTFNPKTKAFTGFYQSEMIIQPEFITINPYNKLIYSSFGVFKEGIKEPAFKSVYTRSMAFSPQGYLFGAAYRTLIASSFEFDALPSFYTNFKDVEKHISNDLISCNLDFYRAKAIFYDTLTHKIWVSTVDNLLVYDTLGNKKTLNDPNGNQITGAKIIQDAAGKIWVGTTNNGLYVFEDTLCILHLNGRYGLPEQGFRQFSLIDNELFALIDSRIFKINPSTYKIEEVKELHDLGFSHISSFAVSDSLFWLCVPNGIAYFDRFLAVQQHEKPLFWIEKIQLADSILSQTSKMTVSYYQNNLQLALQPLLFISKTFQFQYRITKNGMQGNWQKLPIGATQLNFEALEHGDYQLELQLFHVDASTFSEISSFEFSIQTPFWLKWWFFVVEAIAILALVGISTQWTKQRLRRKQLFKERLLISQMTALRSQMNPHFLYNVLSSVQGLIYSDKINEASDYVSQFSQHLRNSLQFSTELEIPIDEEINGIKTYLSLEKLRFGEDFSYQVVKLESIYENFRIPSMIIQPFVENAVKHGLLHKKGLKKLIVTFNKVENHLFVTIEDNGIGREASALINAKRKDKPSSFATKAIDERISLLNYHRKDRKQELIRLHIEDLYEYQNSQKIAIGTSIELIIPLSIPFK